MYAASVSHLTVQLPLGRSFGHLARSHTARSEVQACGVGQRPAHRDVRGRRARSAALGLLEAVHGELVAPDVPHRERVGRRPPRRWCSSVHAHHARQRFYREHLLPLSKRRVGTDARGDDVFVPVAERHTPPRPTYRDDLLNWEEFAPTASPGATTTTTAVPSGRPQL